MKTKATLILLMFLIVSCSSGTLETKIREQIQSQCINRDCVIKIADITPFKWDRMVAFETNPSPEQIHKVIGVDYVFYSGFQRPLIFMLKNKIVYSENDDRDVENPTNGMVSFDLPDTVKYVAYSVDKAMFHAKVQTYGDVTYYLLYQR